MQAFRKFTGLALATAAIATLATGCETGRGNKRHFHADHISDVTTTGKKDAAFVANPEGLPPVPGSPTAAGPDGKQPYNDANARRSPGAEDGMAAAPNQHHQDAFVRQ